MKNKIIAALFAAVTACGVLSASACAIADSSVISVDTAAEAYPKGDVNMDGKVDLADALIVQLEYLHYFTGYECTFNEEQMKLATIVGQSTEHPKKTESIPFSVADAQVILQYYTCKDVSNVIDDNVSVTDFWQNYDSYMPHEKQGDEIAFTEISLSKESTLLGAKEQDALNSCLILNMASLEQLMVQPSKTYTPDFFENHLLIMISKHFSCVTDPPTITSVRWHDKIIEITASRKIAYDEEVEWWCTFLEVSKSDLPEMTEASNYEIQIQIQTLPKSDEIAFTEVAADYSKFSGGTELQKNNEAKSRVIYNSEQLAHNPIQPVNPYSDAFFEDHALIFVCIVFQSMASDSPVITGIHCEDHSIQIAAEREYAPMEMVELWCTFLEVKKTDLPAADEEVVFDFDITEGDETNTNKIHIVQ